MNLDRVPVRNLRKGPAVLDNPDDSRKYYSWGGKGSLDGSDVVLLPADMINSSQFEKAMRLGVFEIVEKEAAQVDLDKQAESQLAQEASKDQTTRSAIDHTANRSINTTACIAPDARGTGHCDQQVVHTEANNGAPPLCTKHANLQSQYTQIESWENDEKVVTWKRVVIER